jgi:hypothetical protein
MATDAPAVLYKEWQRNELSVERAVGQLLQHLVAQSQRLAELERRLREVEQAQGQPPASAPPPIARRR